MSSRDTAQMPNKLLLRPQEVATMLGLSRSRIYELMRAGALPAIHVGRSVRIPMKVVEAWVDEQVTSHIHSSMNEARHA